MKQKTIVRVPGMALSFQPKETAVVDGDFKDWTDVLIMPGLNDWDVGDKTY